MQYDIQLKARYKVTYGLVRTIERGRTYNATHVGPPPPTCVDLVSHYQYLLSESSLDVTHGNGAGTVFCCFKNQYSYC